MWAAGPGPQGQKQFALDHFVFVIMVFNEASASLLWPCYVFSTSVRNRFLPNCKRANETAGILKQRINYFFVVISKLKWL